MLRKPLLASLLFAAAYMPSAMAAEDTIKVGVLHSLSGTMAISETTLKDTVLMMVEDANAHGGLLGKKLEAVVVDPKSDWPTFAAMAEQLLTKDKVAVVFGCWTSVSRKHVLPVFEKENGLLFYPVQYEGQEQSKNVFYTGAAPNQQAIPAVEYLMSKEGGSVERWVLAGTDYVYPRTTNQILEAFLKSKGVKPEDIMINYTPFGHKDWDKIVADIKAFGSAGKKTAVVSTINGDANVGFYKALATQSVTANKIPVVAFSVGEQELASLDVTPLVGHLTAWNYFMSLDNSENEAFIAAWHKYIKDSLRVTNDPMEATWIGFKMWTDAVKKTGAIDVDKVREAMKGLKLKAPSGVEVTMDPVTQHLHKPVFIGEIKPDGQMQLVWQSAGAVAPVPWSPYIAKTQ